MKRHPLILLPLLLIAQTTKPADYYADSPEDFAKRTELSTRITAKSFDQPLIEAAVFHETNRQRAAHNLPPFKHGFAPHLMARRHSTEMATLHYFDHTSPTPENSTLGKRLKNVGLTATAAGENIAVLPAMEMGSGRYIVKPNDDGSKTLIDEATGKRIDFYSYANLAKAVVDQWMNSPSHRENILNPHFTHLGVGAGRGTYDGDQDSFYFTQNFTNGINQNETAAAKELSR